MEHKFQSLTQSLNSSFNVVSSTLQLVLNEDSSTCGCWYDQVVENLQLILTCIGKSIKSSQELKKLNHEREIETVSILKQLKNTLVKQKEKIDSRPKVGFSDASTATDFTKIEIENYNLKFDAMRAEWDSLRTQNSGLTAELQKFKDENLRLRKLLDKSNILLRAQEVFLKNIPTESVVKDSSRQKALNPMRPPSIPRNPHNELKIESENEHTENNEFDEYHDDDIDDDNENNNVDHETYLPNQNYDYDDSRQFISDYTNGERNDQELESSFELIQNYYEVNIDEDESVD